jgi:hypothetical protein
MNDTTTSMIDKYNLHTNWRNYGDANPDLYGGRFARWDGRGIKIVETDLWDEETGEQMIVERRVKLDGAFIHGDPSKGFTGAMYSVLESFGDRWTTPETFEFQDRFIYYAVDLPFHLGMDMDPEFHEIGTGDDYWDYMEARFDITEDSL